jgi:hypothetical protein
MITITAYNWVPDFAKGLVRDLHVRWALEEAGLSGSKGYEPGEQGGEGLEERAVNLSLDRSKRRLQALVDGHQFESLDLFSGQYKGREMQGIQCAQ